MSPTTHFVAATVLFLFDFHLANVWQERCLWIQLQSEKTHFVAVWPKHASMNLPMRIFWVLEKDDQHFLCYILVLNLHGNILHYKKLNDVIRI